MPVYTLKPGHVRTHFRGEAVPPGGTVEVADEGALTKDQRATLAAHFDRADKAAGGGPPNKPNEPSKPNKLRNGLTEEQARAKLSTAGFAGADAASGDALADLFDRAFGGTAGLNPQGGGTGGK
jgi:hypothetical protein